MDWYVQNWDAMAQFGFLAYAGFFALLFLLDRLDPLARSNRWLMWFVAGEALARGLVLVATATGMPTWLGQAAGWLGGATLVGLGIAGYVRLTRRSPILLLLLLGAAGVLVALAGVMGGVSTWLALLIAVGIVSGVGGGIAICHYGPWQEPKDAKPIGMGALIGLLGVAEAFGLAAPWLSMVDPKGAPVWMAASGIGQIASLVLVSALILVFRARLVEVRLEILGAAHARKTTHLDLLFSIIIAVGALLSFVLAHDAGEHEKEYAKAAARGWVGLAASSIDADERLWAALGPKRTIEPGAASKSDGAFDFDHPDTRRLARQRLELLIEAGGRYQCAYLIKVVQGVPEVLLSFPDTVEGCRLTQRQMALDAELAKGQQHSANGPQPFRSKAPYSFLTQRAGVGYSSVTGVAPIGRSHGSGPELWVGMELPGHRAFLREFEARAVPLCGAAVLALLLLLLWPAVLLTFTDEARSRQVERTRLLERAAAEEAVHASEERFRSMSNSARDAIITMDSRGRVTFWNPSAERLFGYSRHEAMGQPLHSFLAPTDAQSLISSRLSEFRISGAGPALGKTREVLARTKDGSPLTVELSLSAMRVGNEWQAMGVARDATERKRDAELLEESKHRLEEANSKLIRSANEAKELAEQASAASVAKSEFLANISHEFRTPLNGIMGAASLLAEKGLSADQRDYVGIVRRSAENLLGILNDILDISKIESGMLELEVLDFDPHALIEDVVELMALRAQEKGLDVSCHTEPYVPGRVRGDPARLRQVLVNLVGNAVKFTPKGEISVQASATELADGMLTLHVEVRDTGIGIPKDKLGRLFQPFTQVDASDTRLYGGTGLGLSICKRLIEQMGGRIEVVSTAGKGSTFRFDVPLQISDALPRGPAPWKDLSNLRVMVLDDHETSRRVLGALLEQWGCIHQEEASLDEALICLREANDRYLPFDVAIVDASGDFSAAERVATWVRDAGLTSKTRLVLMTALGRRGDVGRLKQLGYSGYVTKPVKRGQLHEVLNLVAHGSFLAGQSELVTRYTVQEVGRQRLKVLVVDDGEINRHIAMSMLESLGWRADCAEDADQAFAALARERYELVLMDVQMPGMDGRTATRLIREGRYGVKDPMVPIIAVTAHAGHDEEQACLAAGMDEYRTKPMEMRRLAKVLSRWHEVLRTEARAGADFEDTAELTPAEGPKVFDRAALLERLGGDDSALDGIVALFTNTTPSTLEKIAMGLEQGNMTVVARMAHQLKGSAGNCGAMAMHKVCHHVEKWAIQNDPERAARAMERLTQAFATFQDETSPS